MLPLLAAAAVLQVALVWWARFPLGVPGEWTWSRVPFSTETAAGWVFAAALALLYLAFVWTGGRRLQHSNRWESAAWLTGLVIAGFVWLMGVQAAVPGIAGLSKAHFVLYYPRSSGYFWQARYEDETTAQFLAGYEQRMAEGDYLHIGTHPPGLTLCFRGLSAVCRDMPQLTDFLLWSQPGPLRDAAEEIRARTAATPQRYTPTDAACIWLAALLVQCTGAATVVPLYLFLRGSHNRPTAWCAAALWPLVPALAVFLPKSDALFPFLSILIAWLWGTGWRSQSIGQCGLAGLVLCGGLVLSLAFVPVLVLVVVWTILESLFPSQPTAAGASGRRRAACAAVAALAFAVPVLVFQLVWDLNLLRVWQWNLHNHSQFYAHFDRTYWAWLPVNLAELFFAGGAPLATLALVGICRSGWPARRNSSVLAFAIVWSLLWVSGKNMGEAARLWLLLMPWLVLCAASALPGTGSGLDRPGVNAGSRLSAVWLAVAALQAVVCIATVTGVDGFHFDELLPAAADVGDAVHSLTP
jgi:hypothetical protein